MARRKVHGWTEQVDLNDSDETFYEPDLDKHPDEARCLDGDLAGTEAVDAYFEQTYNRYGGGTPLSRSPRRQDLDTDETHYSPVERRRGRNAAAVRRGLQRPDTDETYYEEGEAQLERQRPDPGRPQRHRVQFDPRVVPETPPVSGLNDDDVDEAFFEPGEHAEASSLFTHDDLEWSQVCWGAWGERQEAANAENDVYVQLPDPVTQELHSYKVPGLRANDPASLNAFTQDFASWAQQSQLFLPAADTAAGGGESSAMALACSQDLEWTQTQNLAWTQTQDLAWTQTQNCEAAASADSQAMDANSADAGVTGAPPTPAPGDGGGTTSAATRQSSAEDQSMESVARPAPPPQRTTTNSSSLESSDANAVPSLPSYEDYAAGPEQGNMEEIVASFQNISFCLEMAGGEAAAGPQTPCAPPAGADGPQQPSQGPRSPTFATNPRRRGRRPRPRTRTDPSDSCSSSAQGAAPASPVLGRGKASTKAPGKRKRPGTGCPGGRRSQPAAPTCSPSSPPRSKARRTTCAAPARNASKGRAEMIPLYARLQQLRFHMHDVIRGKENLPTLEEVAQLSSEVQTIVGSIKQALEFDMTSKQVKLKREEALQVADKILHQLRVLAQIQENSGAAQESSQDNILETSWSNTATSNLCQFIPESSNGNSEIYFEGSNCERPITILESPTTHGNINTSVNEDACGTAHGLQTAAHIIERSRGQVASLRFQNVRGCMSTKNSSEVGLNQSTMTVSHKLPHEDDPQLQENNCGEAINRSKPNFFQENFISGQANVISKTGEVCTSCTCKSSQIESSLRSPSVPSNCTPLKSHQTKQQLLTDYGVPECSLRAENSDQPVMTEHLNIHENSQETEIINSHGAHSLGSLKDGEVNKEKTEYQQLVGFIKKSSEITRTHPQSKKKVENYEWKGGPLKLTGILLPKNSEYSPINDLPPNFWDDPQAPIPEEWVNMLEWDD